MNLKLPVALFGGLIVSTQGLVPDPGNVYYGLARNFLGQVLTPEDDAEVVLVRIESGSEVVLARSPILSINAGTSSSPVPVNYVLRPSLDDGLAARFDSGAGRVNDVVAIYVIHNGVRYETFSKSTTCAPVSESVPALGDRGTVRKVDFRCIDDWDRDCIADSWERQYLSTTQFSGTDDWDGDGANDFAEFMRGSDPLKKDGLEFVEVVIPDLRISWIDPVLVKLEWERQPGVAYQIEWSGSLEEFEDVPAERLSGENSDQVDVTGFSRRFFRVRVGQ